MKITLNIPSNNPESFFNILLPSIEHLKELKGEDGENEITFYLIAQRPWSDIDISLASMAVISEGFNFEYTYVVNQEKPSMFHLRSIGIVKSLNTDYFLMMDDNFRFTSGTPKYAASSGKRYLQCINYLQKYSNCGFVMCEGSLGGNIQKWEISSTITGLFATTRGIVFRNIGADYLCRKTPRLIGGLEESVFCYHIIEEGYYPAKQFNNPTQHKDKAKKGEVKSIIHDQSIWEDNCQWYIRSRYDDPQWTHSSKRWPIGLKKKFLEVGGIKEVFEKRINRVDYKE